MLTVLRNLDLESDSGVPGCSPCLPLPLRLGPLILSCARSYQPSALCKVLKGCLNDPTRSSLCLSFLPQLSLFLPGPSIFRSSSGPGKSPGGAHALDSPCYSLSASLSPLDWLSLIYFSNLSLKLNFLHELSSLTESSILLGGLDDTYHSIYPTEFHSSDNMPLSPTRL